MSGPPPVLVVDLDGTLTPQDWLEVMRMGMLRRPWTIPGAVAAARHGKAALKFHLWERVGLDVATMPLTPDLLRWLRNEHAGGRRLVLATGSPEPLARAVADRVGMFDGVFSTTREHNLTGSAKAWRLLAEFGEGGFEYVGNSAADVAVWRHCPSGYACNATDAVIQAGREATELRAVFGAPGTARRLQARVAGALWGVAGALGRGRRSR